MEGKKVKTPIATIIGAAALGLATVKRRTPLILNKGKAIEVSLHFSLRIPIHSNFCIYEDMDKADELILSIMNNNDEILEKIGIEIRDVGLEQESKNTDELWIIGTIKLGHIIDTTTVMDVYRMFNDKLSEFVRHINNEFVDVKGSKKKIKVESENLEQDKIFVKKNETIAQIYTNQYWFQVKTFLKSKRPMREIDIEMSHPKNVLVNASTGQIYEPPEQTRTKLRKR